MTHQPALSRVVGLWGAVWMGLGSILGTGVFVSLGIATGVVGTGVILAVALAALVAIANGLSSAQQIIMNQRVPKNIVVVSVVY